MENNRKTLIYRQFFLNLEPRERSIGVEPFIKNDTNKIEIEKAIETNQLTIDDCIKFIDEANGSKRDDRLKEIIHITRKQLNDLVNKQKENERDILCQQISECIDRRKSSTDRTWWKQTYRDLKHCRGVTN